MWIRYIGLSLDVSYPYFIGQLLIGVDFGLFTKHFVTNASFG